MLVWHGDKALYKVSVKRFPNATRICQVEYRSELDRYVEGLESCWGESKIKVEFLGHLTTVE